MYGYIIIAIIALILLITLIIYKIQSHKLELTTQENLYKYTQARKEEIDKSLEEQRQSQISQLNKEIDFARSEQKIKLTNEYNAQRAELELELTLLNNDIINKREELDDLHKEQLAINQSNFLARKSQQDLDFYTIQFSDEIISDLEIINSIRARLTKTELFNKLIYDNYIKRPVEEMLKRVIQGKPSGIYKVTNRLTQEIYIGKSTDIKQRWTNHVKSAYGLEGVADSQFQRALKKYGVNNFTWEILEEVPKENLTEAEKRWIEFYGAKDFGYNQRLG